MQFSYNWLQSFFNKKLPKPDKLVELLMTRAFEVECVEKKGSDYIIDADILPNRAHDCLSHLGLAKEIATILDLKIKVPKFSAIKHGKRSAFTVNIKEPDLCCRYIGVAMSGVKIDSSPKWLKDRLKVLDQNSINNLVDLTNYVMLELGQPMHAFDADKVEGEIVVRRALAGEKITTLDNQNVDLTEDMLIIADQKSPLAIAGIKGGKKAEITKDTKNIILESANFNASGVRKTSRDIGIITDSSVRFAASLSPVLAEEAMTRILYLIKENIKGAKGAGAVDVYPKPKSPIKILLNMNRVSALLGVAISDKKAANILKKLGCEVRKQKNSHLLVTPPAVRLDLFIEEDLIEEIGRINGYFNIPPESPLVDLDSKRPDEMILYRNKAREMFRGMGFFEVYNYSFLGDKELELMTFNKTRAEKLMNPVRSEFTFLRPALSPGLLENVKSNLRFAKSLKFFEIGKVFMDSSEKERLAFIIAEGGQDHPSNKDLFFEVRGTTDSIAESLGISDLWFDDVPSSPHEYDGEGNLMHPFQRSQIKTGNYPIGVMGSVHPDILNQYKIRGAAALCELDFEKLLSLSEEENEYRPVSKYPALARDLAILVPFGTRVAEVLNIIEGAGGKLLIDTDLFDVYEGGGLSDGVKSLAFHLIFQSHEKTLKDVEVDAIMDCIINELERVPEWEIRR